MSNVSTIQIKGEEHKPCTNDATELATVHSVKPNTRHQGISAIEQYRLCV